MKDKKICDRCGKEIIGEVFIFSQSDRNSYEEYYWCENCYNDFMKDLSVNTMKDKEIQDMQIRICNACKQYKKCDNELCTMSGLVAEELSKFYQPKEQTKKETAKYLVDEFATMLVALKVGKVFNKKLENTISQGAYLFMLENLKRLAQEFGVEIGENK